MTQYFIQLIESIPGTWALIIVAIILLLCGLGLPVPEEISLFIIGYLAFVGDIRLETGIIVSLLAILIGDSTIFYIGNRFGSTVFQIPIIRKIVNPKQIRRVNVYFRKYGNRVIFLARFMAGVRAPVFLSAGILRMPFQKFILFDGLAALISAPFIIWLTYWFCSRLEGEIQDSLKMVRQTEQTLVIIVAIAVIGFSIFFYQVHKRRKLRRLQKRSTATPTLEQ